jgi:hypothetical protein
LEVLFYLTQILAPVLTLIYMHFFTFRVLLHIFPKHLSFPKQTSCSSETEQNHNISGLSQRKK